MKHILCLAFLCCPLLAVVCTIGCPPNPPPRIEGLGTLPGGNMSSANAINNNGQIVGWSNDADRVRHAVLWNPGLGIQDLATLPGTTYSTASFINDSGQVAGVCAVQGNVFAFIWDATHGMQDLGTLQLCTLPGSTTMTEIAGINNNGQVIGSIKCMTPTTFYSQSPFIWDATHGMQELAAPTGSANPSPAGFNDKGQIVGSITTSSQHAYVWEPW